jgi:hypothetical protein
MSKNKQEKVSEILLSLAEYRCLSVPQLAALHFSSLQTARTARQKLYEDKFVDTFPREYGIKKGRPEFLLALSKRGIDRLIMENRLHDSFNPGMVLCPGSTHIEHQLLLNWVSIHVRRLGNVLTELESHFLFFNSKHLSCGIDKALDITDTARPNVKRTDLIRFIPD